MKINWCLKGIVQQSGFGDAEARSVLNDTGILSAWLLAHGSNPALLTNSDAQNALSLSALDAHVNHYTSVAATTPYISLTAGCYEFSQSSRPNHYPAIATAVRFATRNGRAPGYIFRCWVVTAPAMAADVPGLADEVRDLNIYSAFYAFHRQGEIAAKIYVPKRQIQHVIKIDSNGSPSLWDDGHVAHRVNSNFTPPEHVSNLIPEIM